MKKRTYLIVMLIALTTYYAKAQKMDFSKYKLIFEKKEISILQLDSIRKIHEYLTFMKNESVSPPTLTIIPVKKDEVEKRSAELKALNNLFLNKPVPDFSYTDINGNKGSAKSLKGKIIVMNFWFTQCAPCVMEIPDLNKLVEKYKEKDVVFISFALDKPDVIKEFFSEHPFDYTAVADSRELAMDTFKVSSFPTHLIVNKEGVITFRASGLGENTIKQLSLEIDALAKK
ncbi:MAG: TlpA disulfide reductase family protein [Daejeonella sp.]